MHPAIPFAILIIYGIGWVFVTYVWPFLVEVVFPIIGVGLILLVVAAFAYTSVLVVRDLSRTFREIQSARLAAAPDLFAEEARMGYFFAPAARDDIHEFFVSCLRRAVGRVRDAASNIADATNWPERQFYRVNWLFTVSFGLLTSVLVAALLGFAGLVAALVLATTFGTLALVDLGYMSLRGLFAHCPECHHKSFHLHYDCPACPGRPRRHRHLRPNRAGALWHTCVCGGRIPAHVLTGRGHKMAAYCVLNGHAINRDLIGAAAVHIALAGGPDSGKSTVLVGLLRHLFRNPDFRSLKIRLEDPIQRRRIEGWISDLDRGICPPKTATERQRATTLLYNEPNGTRRALYIFDTSGEMFSSSRLAASHTYFDSSDYIVFTLDPLSLGAFRVEAEKTLSEDTLGNASPSETRPLAVASGLLELLQSHGAKRRRGRFTTPLAVVLTKSDLVLDRHAIGSPAQIRIFIDRYGGGELLRLLEANFDDIRMMHASGVEAGREGADDRFGWLANDIMDHAQATAEERSSLRLRRA